jgi:exportin-2 (importin alpha re-exporter)
VLQELHPFQLCGKFSVPFAKGHSDNSFQDEEGRYKLPESTVVTIKSELIGLMIRVPSSIQAQLGEAISLIADSDFWQRWDTLVDVSFAHARI